MIALGREEITKIDWKMTKFLIFLNWVNYNGMATLMLLGIQKIIYAIYYRVIMVV